MPDALPQLADHMSVARADLRAGAVMLTPAICTMGEEAHFTQYDVFATLGNGKHLMMGDDPRLPNSGFRAECAKTDEHGKRNGYDRCASAARVTKSSYDRSEQSTGSWHH